MDSSVPRHVLALLCLAGVLAIATAAILEVRRAWRGESLISIRQMRWRVFSAVVWMLVLGPLSYALLFLWPHAPHEVGRARSLFEVSRFVSVLNGVALLFFIGLGLLLVDVLQLSRERRRQELAFAQSLETMALAESRELEKKRKEQ